MKTVISELLQDSLYMVKIDKFNQKSEEKVPKEVAVSRKYLSSSLPELCFDKHKDKYKQVSYLHSYIYIVNTGECSCAHSYLLESNDQIIICLLLNILIMDS